MSPRMKALKSFRLRGTRLNTGDVFPVKPKDVPMLTIGKLAEVVEDAQANQKAGQPVSALSSQDLAPRQRAQAAQAKPAVEADQKDVAGMTILELRAHAKELGLRSTTGLSKAELLSRIKGRYNRRDMRADK